MISTYLFDFDDTLIDTKIYAKLYRQLLEKIQKKLHITKAALDKNALACGLKKTKSGRWDTGDLCRELGLLDLYYGELEKQIQVSEVLHDNVEHILKSLKQRGKRIGIVSNSMRRTIELYLKKYRLTSHIDFIFSQDDAGCRKDTKEFWKKLIEKERLTPSECVVIGDHEIDDVETPKKLKFNTLLIKSPKDLSGALNL